MFSSKIHFPIRYKPSHSIGRRTALLRRHLCSDTLIPTILALEGQIIILARRGSLAAPQARIHICGTGLVVRVAADIHFLQVAIDDGIDDWQTCTYALVEPLVSLFPDVGGFGFGLEAVLAVVAGFGEDEEAEIGAAGDGFDEVCEFAGDVGHAGYGRGELGEGFGAEKDEGVVS